MLKLKSGEIIASSLLSLRAVRTAASSLQSLLSVPAECACLAACEPTVKETVKGSGTGDMHRVGERGRSFTGYRVKLSRPMISSCRQSVASCRQWS